MPTRQEDGAVLLNGAVEIATTLLVDGLATFAAGIDVGNTGSWVPVITTSGVAPTSIGYTTQRGTYLNIANIIFFAAVITLGSFTLGAGTGNLRASLPVAAAAVGPSDILNNGGFNNVGTLNNKIFIITNSQAYGMFYPSSGAGSGTPLLLSAIGASTMLTYSGFYFV